MISVGEININSITAFPEVIRKVLKWLTDFDCVKVLSHYPFLYILKNEKYEMSTIVLEVWGVEIPNLD